MTSLLPSWPGSAHLIFLISTSGAEGIQAASAHCFRASFRAWDEMRFKNLKFQI
jgi:hypothetical protein